MNNIQKILLVCALGAVVPTSSIQKMKKAWARYFHPVTQEALFKAAQKGNVAEIRRLVNAGVAVDVRNEYGQTPLIVAAISDKPKAIEELVKLGAALNAQENSGNSALLRALALNNYGAIWKLVKLGADVSLRNKADETALYWAALNESQLAPAVVDLLLRAGAIPDAKFWDTALWNSDIMDACKEFVKEHEEEVLAYRKKKEEFKKTRELVMRKNKQAPEEKKEKSL